MAIAKYKDTRETKIIAKRQERCWHDWEWS